MKRALRRTPSTVSAVCVLMVASAMTVGCATTPELPVPPSPTLPPIPAVHGDLELRVSHPPDSAFIATRDRTFIFGSTGNGDARLWINDEPVEVEPNGAFLAFLPVPTDSVYRLRATLEGETATLEVPVSIPPPPGGPEITEPAVPGVIGRPGTPARIVPGSVSPAGAWVARPGERIPVSFTGTAGGEAWLELGGERVPLVPDPDAGDGAAEFEIRPGEEPGADATDAGPAPRFTTYSGYFAARRVTSPDPATPWPTLTGERRPAGQAAGGPSPGADRAGGEGRAAPTGDVAVVLAVRGDTVVRRLPVNLLLADPDRPPVGVGWDPDPPARNGDAHIIARPGPGSGPYHYVWRNGVELELTGERNGAYRVRLTDDLSAWTPADEIRLQPAGTPPPESRVAVVRLDPQPGQVDVHVNLGRRLPYAVTEADRSLSLHVFGATSRASFLQHGRVDPYIDRAEWDQPADRHFRLDLHLTGPVWGYEVFWSGDDIVLRLNRPPSIDPVSPLRGLTIGVDPGHGGAQNGAMGPTGLREAEANLAVGLALRDRLEAAGATVVMTRTTDTIVSLVERTSLARDRDVDLLVSVHNNAFPDGVNPWQNNGTSVYYNHARAAGLAWAVQRALLHELGLRDIGVGRADLHLPRFTWAPSILTETAFMMIPIQEAFLASDEGARRIADAHYRGIVAWLTTIGGP